MRRLQIVSSGKVVDWPWDKDEPALVSINAPWRGFQLEYHRSCETPRYVGQASWPSMQIALITQGSVTTHYRTGFREHHYRILPGSVFIYPEGYEMTCVRSSGAFDAILAQLDGRLVSQLLPECETLGTHIVLPQHNIVDDHVSALLRAMQDEIQDGCPAGQLYAESLSLALISYITNRFAAHGFGGNCGGGGFSRLQFQRLTEFINSRLEDELSVIELASVARLSPRHFMRLFKGAFGLSPHQYVMCERVKRAKGLLAARKASISEIALSLGFGNQSCFTQRFHKLTGTTPKRYQREH